MRMCVTYSVKFLPVLRFISALRYPGVNSNSSAICCTDNSSAKRCSICVHAAVTARFLPADSRSASQNRCTSRSIDSSHADTSSLLFIFNSSCIERRLFGMTAAASCPSRSIASLTPVYTSTAYSSAVLNDRTSACLFAIISN